MEGGREEGSSFRMVLACIIANLPGLSVGLAMGFSAILIPQLQEPDSSINATLEQGSWIASLFVIGDLLGCVIGGPLADKFGRRAAICLDCIPLIGGWFLIWFATSLHHLYIARAITGVGIGAGVPIASIYMREISTPKLRGTLVILMPAAANTGNLLMYILGWGLPWRLTTLPGALIPILPILLLVLIPESPSWLLSRGRREEAIKSLSRLRGLQVDSSAIKEEMRMIEGSSGESDVSGEAPSIRLTISRIFKRTVLLPMALLVFLFFTQSFSGSNMVSYYTITIFQMANIPLDENLASVLVAAQYVLGYSLSSLFVTKIPRRTLLFASLTIMTLANLSAGLVLLRQQPEGVSPNNSSYVSDLGITENDHKIEHHKMMGEEHEMMEVEHKMIEVEHGIVEADLGLGDPGPVLLPEPSNTEHMISLVPVISCILITFGYACGLGPVPFILFGELFPNSVRGPASSITAFLRSITVFLSIKIFPSLLWLFDIGGSFLSCAVVCAFAIVVSYLCVPETKGMDTKQLESIYSGRQYVYKEDGDATDSSLLEEDSTKASPRGQETSTGSNSNGISEPVKV